MPRASAKPNKKSARTRKKRVEGATRRAENAFAFIKLRDGCDRVDAFQRLSGTSGVAACNAVNGEHDIVLVLHGGSLQEIKSLVDGRIRSLSHVVEVEMLPVIQSGRGGSHALECGPPAAAMLSVYLFLEVEKRRVRDVLTRLRGVNGVVVCAATDGSCQITACVQAPGVCDLQRLLNEELGKIDGISCIRTARIIPMIER